MNAPYFLPCAKLSKWQSIFHGVMVIKLSVIRELASHNVLHTLGFVLS